MFGVGSCATVSFPRAIEVVNVRVHRDDFDAMLKGCLPFSRKAVLAVVAMRSESLTVHID